MAPNVDTLKAVRMMMVGAGVTPPSSGLKYRLMATWNYVMLALASWTFFNSALGFFYMKGEDLALQLENLCFLLSTMSTASRFMVITFRKQQFFSHLGRMAILMDKIEKVNGAGTFLPVKKKADFVAAVNAVMLTSCCLPVYAHTYYKYYFEGDEDAVPYGTYTPFDNKNNVHKNVLYQALMFYSIVYCVIMTNTLIISMALTTSSIIAKVSDQFESLSMSKNISALIQAIQWHSEIIKIVEETNSLFGIVAVFDFLISSVYISIGGYLLVKVGLVDKSSLPKYLILYSCFMFNPSFFCYGGHLISSENDRLVMSIFSNDWYNATPRERKYLILPGLMAKKRLSWNYKGFVYMDMGTYSMMMKQSYSFITLLRLME